MLKGKELEHIDNGGTTYIAGSKEVEVKITGGRAAVNVGKADTVNVNINRAGMVDVNQ